MLDAQLGMLSLEHVTTLFSAAAATLLFRSIRSACFCSEILVAAPGTATVDSVVQLLTSEVLKITPTQKSAYVTITAHFHMTSGGPYIPNYHAQLCGTLLHAAECTAPFSCWTVHAAE